MLSGTGLLRARAQSPPFLTNATCVPVGSEDWSWMNNDNGYSPCLTAAAVISPCFNAAYRVIGLQPGSRYDPPTGTFITPCYCSWATYNLLSACAVCQDQTNGVTSWFSWTQACGAYLTSDRAYPPGAVIPQNTTFPNWAATDPTTWENGRFNATQAKTIEESKPGDLQDPTTIISSTPTPNQTQSKKNNVGAIAGGVIGGVIIIAIGIAAGIFMYCRNQKRKTQTVQRAPPMAQAPTDHARSPSDFSAKSFGSSGLPFNSFGPAPSPSNSDSRLLSSPTTFRTHNTSRGSLPQESLMGLSYAGTPPPQQGNLNHPNIIMTAQGPVSPFTLERPSSSEDTRSGHDRKRSEASANSISTTPPRGPMNPPAYSEAPGGHGDFSSQAPDQASTYGGSTSIYTTPPTEDNSRPHHERGVSSSTTRSDASSISSGGLWTHAGSASLSGAADLISRMGSVSGPGPSGDSIPTYSGPGPNVHVPRDEKRG
ncbi:hypothetical protein NP233_g1612 [Leucocoprinus birnbaumii]|uniref:Uncharacterized protein n=1 Tax=Leucocoprinus birnbaumii TaxID=56174 RepID=A0AAD5YXU9_9AGAR|nr:hypothetical protein NP233_g1612 [Leucocoprinus birnbaumii]